MSESVTVRQKVLRFAEPECSKIDGGFVTIPVRCLAIVWWAYRTKRISRAAFRAYFACHELETRRAMLRRKFDREYDRVITDFVRLLGGDPKKDKSKESIRTAFRELRNFGLVNYGEDYVFRFSNEVDSLKLTDEERADLERTLETFANPKRPVPVPRRILRRLAGGMSRSRTGVLIAYLIRCLFYRKGEGVTAKGCCKASWIAEAFGISERSVFDARDYLIHELGWLTALPTPQKVLNRYGLWVTVDLAWNDPDSRPKKKGDRETNTAPSEDAVSSEPVQNLESPSPDGESGFADPSADFPSYFAGPLKISLSSPEAGEGTENQNHPSAEATADPASGFYVSQDIPENRTARTLLENRPDSDGHIQPPADIRNVVTDDLKDYDRLCELRRQAVDAQLLGTSEADRIRFFAAVVHARNVGKDPVRLFSWMLRSKRWDMITQADEEEAVAKLKAKERQRSGIQEERRGRSLPTLSDDARLVQAILATYRERRMTCYSRSVHEGLRRHDASWTDDRFVLAWLEVHPGQHPYRPGAQSAIS